MSLDFTKLKVADIKSLIKQNFGLDDEEIDNIKGKSALVNFYNSLAATDNEAEEEGGEESENIFDQLEPEQDNLEFNIIEDETEVEFDQKMDRTNPGWSNYVLSHLSDDEKDHDKKGNIIPKTDGLKRLIESLIGPIMEIETNIIQAPSPDNGGIATIRSSITVLLPDGREMKYNGTADCIKSDCDPPYNKFVSAIAETRAEGRAYRKILGLKNVTTSEEIIGADKEDIDIDGEINKTQIGFIDIMCNNVRGKNLNVKELFHKITGKSYNVIQRYTNKDAFDVTTYLNELQKSEDRPEDIGGYDPNWRSSFST